MKRNYFVMMLMVAGLMMSACGSQQKTDGEAVESDDTEEAAADAESEEEQEFQGTPQRGIDDIREVWERKPLKVDVGNGAPGIKELALAFCKAYPQCETNEAMRNYLSSPDADSKDTYQLELPSRDEDYPITYDINCSPRKGYISCMAETQTDRLTTGCYWNRKNGHKLFAVFMDECVETTDWYQCLVVFYDYDPATKVMTPEPGLANMIEKRMLDYACYGVRLPEEGKDIEVYGFTSIEEDGEDGGFEYFDLKLKWNGDSFDWEAQQ